MEEDEGGDPQDRGYPPFIHDLGIDRTETTRETSTNWEGQNVAQDELCRCERTGRVLLVPLCRTHH